MTEPAKPAGSWTEAFPTPRTTAPSISREHVLSELSSPDLLLVDVRRTDYEGGTIKGSINLPAQSFYMNRGVLYDLCRRAGVKQVAFYCGESESDTSLSLSFCRRDWICALCCGYGIAKQWEICGVVLA